MSQMIAIHKEMADIIYNYCQMDTNCTKIIDTPAFQRLRNIKQLSTVHYVFPNAHHSRFDSFGLATCFRCPQLDSLRLSSDVLGCNLRNSAFPWRD